MAALLSFSRPWPRFRVSQTTPLIAQQKASIRSIVRTWTAELKGRDIRVNAISPGAIDTPIFDAQANTAEGADAIRASLADATPLDRLGQPEEIAAAGLFLASDESSYVAGVDLVVDGGLSAL